MFGGSKSNWNKKLIVIVEKDNGYESIEMKAKRSRLDDGTYFYEFFNPKEPAKTYKMQDIPENYFSLNGVGYVLTRDMNQFVPAHISFIDEDKIMFDLLTGEQKEWYARSLKRDYEKLNDKSWWNQNKTFVLFLATIAVLGFVLYFSYAHWGAYLVSNTHAINDLSTTIKHIPVVPTPKPPA